jgi:peptidylprolyl isomerase
LRHWIVALAVVALLVLTLGGCAKPQPPVDTTPVVPPPSPAAMEKPAAEPPPAADAKPAAEAKPEEAAKSKVPTLEGEKGKPVVTTKSGLKYVVLAAGSGKKPTKGATVVAEYTGWLTDGTKFDSSKDHPDEFSFAVGTGGVIPAWDEALLDMKVGERRKLTVPADLGYGASGTPGGPIPPNATLIFEVKLVKIK